MTDEQLLMLGVFSTTLLASDEFKQLHTLFKQQVAVDMLDTKPTDAKERERLYGTVEALSSFISHIQGFANAGEQLTKPDAEEPGQDIIDDPAVHDIAWNERL